MIDYKIIEVNEKPYIYVALQCSMDPEDVRKTMGKGFTEVAEFMQANDIDFAGPALSVYYSYDEDSLDFRTGFFIKESDMKKVSGNCLTAHTPSGQVLSLTHTGSYNKLRDTYEHMMKYMESKGMEIGKPTWEVYVTDPDSTPEEDLRTDIYVSLSSVSTDAEVKESERV